MAYKYNERVIHSWKRLCEIVAEDNPELLDDSLVEFIEAHLEEVENEV